MSTFSTSAKFLALILLLQIIVAVTGKSRSALRKSAINKAKQFDVTPFKKAGEAWARLAEDLQKMSDAVFDSFNSNGAPVPIGDFTEGLKENFPFQGPSAENSKNKNFWLIDVDTSATEVNRDLAFTLVLNSISGSGLDMIEGQDTEIPEGPHKAQIQNLVSQVYINYNSMKKLVADVFSQADADHSGLLSLQEFKDSFALLFKPTDDVEAIFHKLDADNSGELDLDEASHIVGNIISTSHPLLASFH